jgi:hypothetical protein
MPWIIGIDEAGYGPNLGPLVMTSVACKVPEVHHEADLWHLLRTAVRRADDKDDGRLLVADSKVVYSSTRGLHALENGVLAALAPCANNAQPSLLSYLDWLTPAGTDELRAEPWFHGKQALPVIAEAEGCNTSAARLLEACHDHGILWARVRSVIVCPMRFNRLLDEWGSKGAVLGEGLTELVQWNRDLGEDEEPLDFFVDKHGGRNTYAPLLQNAIPDGLVMAQQEGMSRSVYRVLGAPQPTRFTFQPRADSEHFCVALASMVSKYLREVLMLEFNRFWQQHVPGLKPTAGYPGDAARFFEAIRPALGPLGLAEETVWRRK